MSQTPIGPALAHLAPLLRKVGSKSVDRCELCGKPADRMVCLGCRAECEAQHERDLASMDAVFRRIVKRAKEVGELNELDQRWLVANGHKVTVEGLDERFRREADKRGGRTTVRKRESGAGFETGERR